MKKYEAPEIELCAGIDVITTSSGITTGGVNVQWQSNTGQSTSAHQGITTSAYFNLDSYNLD